MGDCELVVAIRDAIARVPKVGHRAAYATSARVRIVYCAECGTNRRPSGSPTP